MNKGYRTLSQPTLTPTMTSFTSIFYLQDEVEEIAAIVHYCTVLMLGNVKEIVIGYISYLFYFLHTSDFPLV